MNAALPNRRFGFTLVELVVVIGIILFLMAISITVIGNMIGKAREAATAATILKINGLLEERLQAFARAFEDTDLTVSLNRMAVSLRANGIYVRSVNDPAVRILVRKDLFRENFPQKIGDRPSLPSPPWPMASNPLDPTESSELLYYVLTQADVFGVPPVDASEFRTSEVKDTDGDTLLEFVDAWGNPLRFYRWPTRLFKPWGPDGPDGVPGSANGGGMGNGDDDDNGMVNDLPERGWPGTDDVANERRIASLLFTGLPAVSPLGERDPLNEDPDDTLSRLTHSASPAPFYFNNWFNEANYHTPDTYHVPLIVSAGPDEVLGLYEPTNVANKGYLAEPIGAYDPPTSTTPVAIPSAKYDAMLNDIADNITNRNRRAGGN